MEVEQPSQDDSADNVMESMGVSDEAAMDNPAPATAEPEQASSASSNESLAVQKRLKAQKRAHEREVRELHARIGDLESRLTEPALHSQAINPHQMPQGNDMDSHIHKAVSLALQAKDAEERKAREQEQMAHVHRQYGELQKHLDNMSDKYDDFHDVVTGSSQPFTSAMRDYALTLPKSGPGSAGEVLYKLGKDPELLSKISKLHPLEQASEMARLSHALISGGESKNQMNKPPLGNIKSNPVVNTPGITEKTSVSDLRKRMKAGWK